MISVSLRSHLETFNLHMSKLKTRQSTAYKRIWACPCVLHSTKVVETHFVFLGFNQLLHFHNARLTLAYALHHFRCFPLWRCSPRHRSSCDPEKLRKRWVLMHCSSRYQLLLTDATSLTLSCYCISSRTSMKKRLMSSLLSIIALAHLLTHSLTNRLTKQRPNLHT